MDLPSAAVPRAPVMDARVERPAGHEAVGRLVERARSAELSPAERREAFVALVERFQDAAYGYAYSLLADPHLAQDATQEALAAAYCRLGELRTPDAFPLWLRRVVRTHC